VLELGYALSSEEHGPCELVDQARRAEEVGFSFALISDHFHPWVSRQGQSPFVWSVIGAIAQATDRIRLGTGVTCPIRRFHPALAAHAAATAAAMMPGRFFLGVGSGEHLNEHIFGEAWPPPETRLEMLEEAIGLIRALWSGESTSRSGAHFRVDEAQIYTLPEAVPPICVAASGPSAASLAARVGDGLIATSPDADLVGAFRAEGGSRTRDSTTSTCIRSDPVRRSSSDSTRTRCCPSFAERLRGLSATWPVDCSSQHCPSPGDIRCRRSSRCGSVRPFAHA